MIYKSAALASCLAALLTVPVFAQTENNPTTNPSTTTATVESSLSHSDKVFFKKAAKGGMKEVDVSKAVLPKLTNPSAQQFAQTMITDHTAANNDLSSLAAKKGVELPAPDDDVTKKWADKTDDVEKDYVKEMISDHKDTIKLFEKAAKSEDADIAAFAQKTLPTLQHHLEMAEGLQPSGQ